MKNTLLTASYTILGIVSFTFLTSCDGSSDSTSNNDSMMSGIDMMDSNNNSGNSSNADCFEGETYRFQGTQNTKLTISSPVSSVSDTETIFDITTSFLSGGLTQSTGTVEVTKIAVTIAGFTSNQTAGLGTTNVDTTGTYTCDDSATNGSTSGTEFTFVDGGITTKYTLTFSSEDSGTFATTIDGTQDGGTIDASSSGTFTRL